MGVLFAIQNNMFKVSKIFYLKTLTFKSNRNPRKRKELKIGY